ncbi:unnamed protein product [Protopolystoma xenopodis]|uniref:Uncharacterized protein n=1 Tax=Protopolystoma xenopodis TaxID=117903 RepID=A0A3S4ZV49_9PLAT|nr:unnamed protein product [Protopolystoma xenopodis]
MASDSEYNDSVQESSSLGYRGFSSEAGIAAGATYSLAPNHSRHRPTTFHQRESRRHQRQPLFTNESGNRSTGGSDRLKADKNVDGEDNVDASGESHHVCPRDANQLPNCYAPSDQHVRRRYYQTYLRHRDTPSAPSYHQHRHRYFHEQQQSQQDANDKTKRVDNRLDSVASHVQIQSVSLKESSYRFLATASDSYAGAAAVASLKAAELGILDKSIRQPQELADSSAKETNSSLSSLSVLPQVC